MCVWLQVGMWLRVRCADREVRGAGSAFAITDREHPYCVLPSEVTFSPTRSTVLRIFMKLWNRVVPGFAPGSLS